MRYVIWLLFWLLYVPAYAASKEAPLLAPLYEQSRIAFVATQNHAPVEGQFKDFTLEIRFAPDRLSVSSVKAQIALASVQVDYDEVADNLKGESWFDVAQFPQAIFESHHFTHKGGNQYEAEGTLSLHGHSVPVTLPFTLTTEANGVLRIEGETILKRRQFGIGSGEWATSSVVEDEVKVKVVAAATSPE